MFLKFLKLSNIWDFDGRTLKRCDVTERIYDVMELGKIFFLGKEYILNIQKKLFSTISKRTENIEIHKTYLHNIYIYIYI